MGSGSRYRGWGHNPSVSQVSKVLSWIPDSCPAPDIGDTVLAFGNGRSYGDSCLNSVGTLIDTKFLNRFIEFDQINGILRAESGITLADILDVIVPRGWFLPVTPGTSQATLGGCIANDVHGKNHHADGSFGNHVVCFTLLRSDGERLVCGPWENADYFSATMGGLGLTGLISDVTIRLLPIKSSFMEVKYDVFHGLQEFADLSNIRKSSYRYTVAWLDCVNSGASFARGVFFSANHLTDVASSSMRAYEKKTVNMPFNLPPYVLNNYSISAFNSLYFRHHKKLDGLTKHEHFSKFFYPLDSIGEWYRIYGKEGFHQYQFVVPLSELNSMEIILKEIVKKGIGSFLAVLKEFGGGNSPGLLSFPRPGWCLALDFANRREYTYELIQEIDKIVMDAGGAVYPAKDKAMSHSTFVKSFPHKSKFETYIDRGFSSDFWCRVGG